MNKEEIIKQVVKEAFEIRKALNKTFGDGKITN